MKLMRLENITDEEMIENAKLLVKQFLEKDCKQIFEEIEMTLSSGDFLFTDHAYAYEKLTWSENLLYGHLIEARDLLAKLAYYFEYMLVGNNENINKNNDDEPDKDEL